MITIPKKYESEIVEFQKAVSVRQVEDERKFAALCKKLKIKPDGDRGMCLFDFIYNDPNFNVVRFK